MLTIMILAILLNIILLVVIIKLKSSKKARNNDTFQNTPNDEYIKMKSSDVKNISTYNYDFEPVQAEERNLENTQYPKKEPSIKTYKYNDEDEDYEPYYRKKRRNSNSIRPKSILELIFMLIFITFFFSFFFIINNNISSNDLSFNGINFYTIIFVGIYIGIVLTVIFSYINRHKLNRGKMSIYDFVYGILFLAFFALHFISFTIEFNDRRNNFDQKWKEGIENFDKNRREFFDNWNRTH